VRRQNLLFCDIPSLLGVPGFFSGVVYHLMVHLSSHLLTLLVAIETFAMPYFLFLLQKAKHSHRLPLISACLLGYGSCLQPRVCPSGFLPRSMGHTARTAPPYIAQHNLHTHCPLHTGTPTLPHTTPCPSPTQPSPLPQLPYTTHPGRIQFAWDTWLHVPFA